MIQPLFDAGIRTFGMLPIGAIALAPPLHSANGVWFQASVLFGRELLIEHKGPAESFSLGLVIGGLYELAKTFISDRFLIKIKRVQRDFAYGPFSVGRKAVLRLRPHQEPAAIQSDHTVGRSCCHVHPLSRRFARHG